MVTQFCDPGDAKISPNLESSQHMFKKLFRGKIEFNLVIKASQKFAEIFKSQKITLP